MDINEKLMDTIFSFISCCHRSQQNMNEVPETPNTITRSEMHDSNLDSTLGYGRPYGDDASLDGSLTSRRSFEHSFSDAAANDETMNASNNNSATHANHSSDTDNDDEDPLTTTALRAVTNTRHHIYQTSTTRLQNILQNIKDATKVVLSDLNNYLIETEEVEKVYIKLKAASERESERLEGVEPDVVGATSSLFGGSGVGGGGFAGMMGNGENGPSMS